jgi:hypothetical protein
MNMKTQLENNECLIQDYKMILDPMSFCPTILCTFAYKIPKFRKKPYTEKELKTHFAGAFFKAQKAWAKNRKA